MGLNHLTDDQFQEYLDGRPDFRDAGISEHLDGCELCRRQLRQYEELYGYLGEDEGFALPTDFAASVVARVEQEISKTSLSVILPVVVGASAFAAVLAVILYYFGASPWLKLASTCSVLLNSLESKTIIPAREFLASVHINPELLVVSILILASINLLDYLYRQSKQKPSSMCL
ncbi:MAG: hypothetical protein JSV44_10065 [Candidatus Zixiibacteriota bacterium]|nr:MAG: hypothetical protein JSV44_10065 [candidate division Zixibacteria bacterium]